MAIRRLNYTGRKRIKREDVSILLYDNPATFDADLTRLAEYTLPKDAFVFVEARLQTRWMRFKYGTVGAITPDPDRRLTEFDSAEGIRFSVKVTATSEKAGKLLAEADRIPGLTHHNSESGLAGKPCLLVKSKLLDHIFATFR